MLPPTTCPNCNRPVQPGLRSCPYCGYVLQSAAPQVYSAAQPQRPAIPQPTYQQTPMYAAVAPQPSPGGRSGALVLALIGVSVLAVVEAIVILVLLLTGGQRNVTAAQGGTGSGVVQQGGSGPSGGTDLPRGAVGQRVESAGIAITVVQVADKPDADVASVLDLSPEQLYIAPDVLLENNSGDSIFFASASIKLRDVNGYEYSQYPLAYRRPKLDFGTLANREKVRGYVNFIVPKGTTGLSLIYQNGAVPGYSTIYIDLGR